eukprot:GHVL01027134.1.p1 GENE.GHVL01027134.1~~GHVL01027134.1.p1  ORF type:complete len:678 (-),score=79.56 GHVL01027134.1:1457-3490(-)
MIGNFVKLNSSCLSHESRRLVNNCYRLQHAAFAIIPLKSKRKERPTLNERNPARMRKIKESPTDVMRNEVYTPELLSTRRLAKDINIALKFDLLDEMLLQRYANRAIQLASTFEGKQFSLILHAVAKSKFTDETLMTVFAKYIPPLLSKFRPQDIALICNAYAKLYFHSPNLMNRISDEIPHKLHLFEPHHMSMVVSAFSKLGLNDSLLLDDIVDEFLNRDTEFGALELTTMMFSLGKMKYNAPKFWKKANEELERLFTHLTPRMAGFILHGFSDTLYRDETAITNIINFINDNIEEFPQTYLTGILINCSKLNRFDTEIFRTIKKRLIEDFQELQPQNLTEIVAAYSKASIFDKELFSLVSTRICDFITLFNAQALCNIAYGYMKLEIRDVPVFTAIAQQSVLTISDFTAQALAITAFSFSKVGIRSKALFKYIGIEALKKLPMFTGQGVALLLSAFARLDPNNKMLFDGCKTLVKHQADEYTALELQLIIVAFKELDSLDEELIEYLEKYMSKDLSLPKLIADSLIDLEADGTVVQTFRSQAKKSDKKNDTTEESKVMNMDQEGKNNKTKKSKKTRSEIELQSPSASDVTEVDEKFNDNKGDSLYDIWSRNQPLGQPVDSGNESSKTDVLAYLSRSNQTPGQMSEVSIANDKASQGGYKSFNLDLSTKGRKSKKN